MSASQTEECTEAVLGRLHEWLSGQPSRDRPGYAECVVILFLLVRWAARGSVDLTVAQLSAKSLLRERTVSKALGALEGAGLVVVERHGGSVQRRGSVRRLTFLSPTGATGSGASRDGGRPGDITGSGASAKGTHAACVPNSRRFHANSLPEAAHSALSASSYGSASSAPRCDLCDGTRWVEAEPIDNEGHRYSQSEPCPNCTAGRVTA